MRADSALLTDRGLAKAVGRAIRKSGATPLNLRKLLRNVRLVKGVNVSGPQDDWPNFSPAPQSPQRQALYQRDIAQRKARDDDARAEQEKRRAEQQAVTRAIADNHGWPLPADHPLASEGTRMRSPLKTTATPEGGRAETADVIRNLHKSAPKSELKRYFSARLVKTDRDHENEREAAVHAEAALCAPRRVFIGNRMSLSDPYGDRLAKGDSHTSALEAIAKAISGRPRRLSKATGLPPEDDGSAEDNTRGDDGADLASDSATSDRASGNYNPRANPTQLGPRHSASITSMRAGPQDADIGPADADPARAGAVSADETTKMIKEIHRNGPSAMWSGR
jgi:hypothetical protein